MNKFAFVLSLAFLAAAVAGRYRAEIAVKSTEDEIGVVETAIEDAEREVRALETSKAYLERPERLEKIALDGTDLEPLSHTQIVSAAEFVAQFDPKADPNGDPSLYYPDQVIRQALAETSEPARSAQ